MPRCRRKPPGGYVPDIRQEPAEGANRAELYGVPQAVGLTPSPINVASVLAVKEEVALELSLFDLADVATVRGGLVVVEEVYRHPAMVSNSRPLPLSVRFRSIVPQPPSCKTAPLCSPLWIGDSLLCSGFSLVDLSTDSSLLLLVLCYLSYYLYMLSVYAGTKGAVLPVYAEMG